MEAVFVEGRSNGSVMGVGTSEIGAWCDDCAISGEFVRGERLHQQRTASRDNESVMI